jgi:hypothetical protein
MRGILPKQFIFIGITLIVVVGVLAFFFWPKKSAPIVKNDSVLAGAAAISKSDSDNDGLLDWEETLLGTNSNKSDTDGDGTNDGDEVKAARNPLIPGPNDVVSKTATSTLIQTANARVQGTLTDQVARDIFNTVIAQKQSGTLDKAHEQALVNTLVDSSQKRALAQKYTVSNLNLVSESTSTRSAYKAAFLSAFSPAKDVQGNELYIVGVSVEKPTDKEARKKADDIVILYKQILIDISKIPVPPSAVSVHLTFLNSFSAYVSAIDSIRTLSVDPVLAAVVLQNYQSIQVNSVSAAQSLAIYFATYHI